jgi:hypothetical protein
VLVASPSSARPIAGHGCQVTFLRDEREAGVAAGQLRTAGQAACSSQGGGPHGKRSGIRLRRRWEPGRAAGRQNRRRGRRTAGGDRRSALGRARRSAGPGNLKDGTHVSLETGRDTRPRTIRRTGDDGPPPPRASALYVTRPRNLTRSVSFGFSRFLQTEATTENGAPFASRTCINGLRGAASASMC